MMKSMSLFSVSMFALSALLAVGQNQVKSEKYLSYNVDIENLASDTNGVIGYFADEVHEYPPLNDNETSASNDKAVIGYLTDEVHEYPPLDKDTIG